jgi:hypothetical protein
MAARVFGRSHPLLGNLTINRYIRSGTVSAKTIGSVAAARDSFRTIMPRTRKRRRSTSRRVAVLVGVVLLVAALAYESSRLSKSRVLPPYATGIPFISVKASPKEITFHGCPPDGDGGDRDLNLLKNRIDEGDYVPVQLAAVLALPWPTSVERVPRRRWSSEDAQLVTRYEGIPLSLEGYLAAAREEGTESTNCRGIEPETRDFHLWLVASPDQDRNGSMVVEVSPRVRASHAGWTIEAIEGLVRSRERVRISGWLMLDPEHPDQVGKTRGTIWEIHPIMKIEVLRNDTWAALDTLASR